MATHLLPLVIASIRTVGYLGVKSLGRIVARLDRKRLGAQGWGEVKTPRRGVFDKQTRRAAGVRGGRWLWELNAAFVQLKPELTCRLIEEL